jgi:UDP-2,3-diacylglucosamine pyrophosphatase LpxH
LATISAKPFLDQFLVHYFSIFDSSRRDLLAGMYHSKAMLSMSASFLDEQRTSEDAWSVFKQLKKQCTNLIFFYSLTFYMGQNRNIKKISDLSKVNQHLHQGSREIMEFFAQFPQTKHKPKSFCIDITQYNVTQKF